MCNSDGEQSTTSCSGETLLGEPSLTDPVPLSLHGTHLLEHAIKQDNQGTVQMILEQYSPTGLVSISEAGILTYAIKREPPNVEMIRDLLVAGVSDGGAGSSPMHAACKAEREDIVSLLIRYGVSVGTLQGSPIGPPLLFTAIFVDSEAIVNTLLRNGASPEADYEGSSALHLAVELRKANSRPIIRLLLAHSTNINTKDASGKEAREYTEDPYLQKLFEVFDLM